MFLVDFNANFVWDFEIKRDLSEEFHEVSQLAKSIIFIKEFKEASVEFLIACVIMKRQRTFSVWYHRNLILFFISTLYRFSRYHEK